MKWSSQHRWEERQHDVPKREGRTRAGADAAHALQGRRSEAPAEGGLPVLVARVADPIGGDPVPGRDSAAVVQIAWREAH